MQKFIERLKTLGLGVARSFRDYPVEALLGLTYFILFILNDHDVTIAGREIGEIPFIFFLPLMIFTFCLHRFARESVRGQGSEKEVDGKGGRKVGRMIWTALYIASGVFWIPIWLFVPDSAGTETIITYLLSFILLFAGCHRQDNETYARTLLHTLIKGIAACIVAGILAGLISGIIGSIDFLFVKGDIPKDVYTYPSALIGFVLTPLLCCLFISEDLMDLKGKRFISVLVDYLLTPALLIYTLILYLYILRILFQWQLPDGGVAYLVGSFIAVALACRLLQELLEVRHFDWFYKYFPYIALAPLALLWAGVLRRVCEYGLTESRCFLIAGSLLLTAFTLMLLFPKARSFRTMSFILGGCAALLTFIPGVRAKDFGIRNQQARLEKVLPQLLVDGRLPENLPYREIAASPELEESWECADGAWSYLQREMGIKAFESCYGQYGNLSFSPWEVEQARERIASGTPEPEESLSETTYELKAPVDLGAYTQLLSPENYWCYEDTQEVVFYADIARKQELLRCKITERLDSCSQAAVTTPNALVYTNDRYMAVFERIVDYRNTTGHSASFITGRKMLFAKPY